MQLGSELNKIFDTYDIAPTFDADMNDILGIKTNDLKFDDIPEITPIKIQSLEYNPTPIFGTGIDMNAVGALPSFNSNLAGIGKYHSYGVTRPTTTTVPDTPSTPTVPTARHTTATAKVKHSVGSKSVDTSSAIVKLASKRLGKPYKWGASSKNKNAYDCSSLTCQVAKEAKGVHLPRTAQAQWKSSVGSKVPYSKATKGDLLYFNFKDHSHKAGTLVTHTGICANDDCSVMIDASGGAGKVRVKKLNSGYINHLVGVKRI